MVELQKDINIIFFCPDTVFRKQMNLSYGEHLVELQKDIKIGFFCPDIWTSGGIPRIAKRCKDKIFCPDILTHM